MMSALEVKINAESSKENPRQHWKDINMQMSGEPKGVIGCLVAVTAQSWRELLITAHYPVHDLAVEFGNTGKFTGETRRWVARSLNPLNTLENISQEETHD